MSEQAVFTTLDDCQISWQLEGPATVPVLLLSNSLGTQRDMWQPQLAALSSRFRVLRYDTRGHGRSQAPVGSYSLDRLGRDVIELLDALELERVHFCGLSLGGMIGQWLGIHAPQRIDHLVLCNTSAYMGPPSSWQQRIETVRREGMAAIAAAVVERWFTPQFQQHSADVVGWIREMLLQTAPEGYLGCCAAIRDMDQRPCVGLIQRPCLVISGQHDRATPAADSAALTQHISAARMVSLNAAHLSNVEQAAEFSRVLLDFLPGASQTG